MDCVDAFSRTEAAGCCCWLLLLVAAVDCCCWLLSLIAAAGCCCWLLLLIVAAGCCCWLLVLVAVVDCCCWLLLLIAQKVLECFRIIVDDLRLRQFCRRKSLWIFSGCWWKVFEYFRVVGEKSLNISRISMGEKWKRGSPRGSRLESEWILWLCACIYTRYFKMAAGWARANRIIWWEVESGTVGSVEQNFWQRQVLKLS